MTLLAYSTNAFTWFPLPVALEHIARLGFDGVELLADFPHLWLRTSRAAEQARWRRCLQQTGLALVNLNANTSRGPRFHHRPELFGDTLCEPEPQVRARRRQDLLAALDCAAETGSPAVSLCSGPVPAGESPAAARARFASEVERLLRHAERRGVRLGLEYEPGLAVSSAGEVDDLVKRFDHPLLGWNLDIGHSHVNGENLTEVLRLARGRLWNVHLEDIRGRRHEHLIPGEGELSFPQLFEEFSRIGYGGPFTLELYTHASRPLEAGRRALDYLRRVLGE